VVAGEVLSDVLVNAPVDKSKDDAKSELIKSKECAICLKPNKSIRFDPCGHYCCCAECSEKVKVCPLCSKAIAAKQAVFNS
jgi:hypothetical protein